MIWKKSFEKKEKEILLKDFLQYLSGMFFGFLNALFGWFWCCVAAI
jgi:hypothetical protein